MSDRYEIMCKKQMRLAVLRGKPEVVQAIRDRAPRVSAILEQAARDKVLLDLFDRHHGHRSREERCSCASTDAEKIIGSNISPLSLLLN